MLSTSVVCTMLNIFVCVCVLLASAVVAKSADEYHPEIDATRFSAPAASPDQQEYSAQYWVHEAQSAIAKRREHIKSEGKARNVVMFLGDGMSVPTLAAARILLGQRQNRPGEEAQLSFEKFPTLGLAKTYCVDAQVPDSACTATAYLCGIKANSGTIGVTAAVRRRNCTASLESTNTVESIAAWALADGRDAGIVTTTRVTHASPAGAYANVANRNWENDARVREDSEDPAICPDIAYQLVNNEPGNKFKVILGGGRREFLPTSVIDEEGTAGRRTDGRNLIDDWQTDKSMRNVSYRYIWNRDQLHNLNLDETEYLLGLFEGTHLQYSLQANPSTEPTLTELTETAIRMLSRNEKGFFLFVEGGRIDHAHHDNRVELALDETIELSAAVERAAELLGDEDSLIVVTADHTHVMSFNGYTPRGGDILGVAGTPDRNGVPYMTVSYTNGPGFRAHDSGQRPDVTQESNFRVVNWRTHVDAPLSSETHGGDDVAVFARGPHSAMFSGLYEQSHVPHLMAYAACLGPGRTACSAAAHAGHTIYTILLPIYIILLQLLK